MNHLYFDTETTGLPNRQAPLELYGRTHNTNGYPKLIQIGWILTDNQDSVLSRETCYVKPDGFVIPADTEQFNGITTDYVTANGEPLLDVLHRFAAVLKQADVIIGHNLNFDIRVLNGELQRKSQRSTLARLNSLPVIDTMKSSVDFCAIPMPSNRHYDNGSGYKYPKLQELHEKLFGCCFDGAHDAMADIEATRRCYVELVKRGIIR